MDESFDEKIRQLLEDGKKLGYNPLSPDSLFKNQEETVKEKLFDTLGLRKLLKEDDDDDMGQHNNDSTLSSPSQPLELSCDSSLLDKSSNKRQSFSLGDLAREFRNLIASDNKPAGRSPNFLHQACVEGDGSFVVGKESSQKSGKSYLEIALENAQMEVAYLQQKLVKSNETHAKQKAQLTASVEELQAKLQQAVSGRRDMLKSHQQEMQEQEDVVSKLQDAVKEVYVSNKEQESSLMEACKKLKSLQNENKKLDGALDQIQNCLSSVAKKLSSGDTAGFADMDKNRPENKLHLANSVTNLFTHLQADNEELKRKVFQLELERNAFKEEHQNEKKKVSSMEQEYESQRAMSEYCSEESKSENARLRGRVKALERRLEDGKGESDKLGQQLQHKKESCKEERRKHLAEMDELEKQISNAKLDVKLANDLVTKLNDEKQKLDEQLEGKDVEIAQLGARLEEEKGEVARKNKLVEEIREEVRSKNSEIDILRDTISQVKSDLAREIDEKVKEVEVIARKEANEQIEHLIMDKYKLADEVKTARREEERREREVADLMVERSELLDKYEVTRKREEEVEEELKEAGERLRRVEGEKERGEKETRKVMEDHSEILKLNQHLQREVEAAQLRVRELEESVERMEEDLKKMGDMMEEAVVEKEQSDKCCEKLRHQIEERFREIRCLEEALCAWEEGKSDVDSRFTRLRDEKDEAMKMADLRQDEVIQLTQEKCSLEKEIIEIRAQIGHLVYEREGLDKEVRELREKHGERVKGLKAQLKCKSKELTQLKESLHTMGGSESNAQLAAQMQSEVTDKRAMVDLLQGELARAHERIKTCERDSKKSKKSFFQLVEKFGQLETEMQKSKEELRHRHKKERCYKQTIGRLEEALQRAAHRNHQMSEFQHHKLLLSNRIATAAASATSSSLSSSTNNHGNAIASNWQQILTSARECLNKFDNNKSTSATTSDVDLLLTTNSCVVKQANNLTTTTTQSNTQDVSYAKDIKDILSELRDYVKGNPAAALAESGRSNVSEDNKLMIATKIPEAGEGAVIALQHETTEQTDNNVN